MNKRNIQNLVKNYSIETTVREAGRIQKFCDVVPAGTRIYIAYVPNADLRDTITLAERLRKESMEPVPHIVARRIASLTILDEFLRGLADRAGISQVLVVAGDVTPPVGELESSLQIFESGLLEKYQIRTIGVAGHPEGHRDVPDSVLRDALRRKNEYARGTGANVYITTQFTFSAEPVITWEDSVRTDIGALAVTVGVPGLATVKTLLRYARDCGVGASLEGFAKRAAGITKLLTVETPDDIVVGVARHRDRHPETHLSGIHFFPFGAFERTAEWANHIVAGNFEITDDDGLRVATVAVK